MHGIVPERCKLMIYVHTYDGDTIVDLLAYDTLYTNERKAMIVNGHIFTRNGFVAQISDIDDVGEGIMYTSVVTKQEVFVDMTHALQRSLVFHKGELTFQLY